MNISVEEKKAEAIKRMKMLKLYPPIIKQFEQKGWVNISEPPLGAHFWLDEDDKKRVADFEAKYNALVFTAVRCYWDIGKMDAYLFVGDYREDWEIEYEDMKHGIVLAYVYNHDAPDCSEMGCISVAPTPAGGLQRMW